MEYISCGNPKARFFFVAGVFLNAMRRSLTRYPCTHPLHCLLAHHSKDHVAILSATTIQQGVFSHCMLHVLMYIALYNISAAVSWAPAVHASCMVSNAPMGGESSPSTCPLWMPNPARSPSPRGATRGSPSASPFSHWAMSCSSCAIVPSVVACAGPSGSTGLHPIAQM